MLGDFLCPDWGFLHGSAASAMMSYINLALVALGSINYTKLALGALLFVFIIFIFLIIWVWHLRRVSRRRQMERELFEVGWKLTSDWALCFTTKEDILGELREENLIGKGGSGNVYRVILQESKLAVKELKKAKKHDKNLDKQFDAEVRTLGGIRHPNIIALLCCITSVCTNLLVYEHMENGSLDQWLHRPRGRLDWPTRAAVAADAATGLSYMHSKGIVHRDVKSSNILLDHDLGAKIGDFGLARVLARPGESEPASAVCGTPGHIAPEYFRDAKVSEKLDIYSFGVVLLELVTGKKPHDAGTGPHVVGLAKWASQQHRKKVRWTRIIDKDIQNRAYMEDIKAVFKLGLRCTTEDPLHRPPMSEVLQQLRRLERRDPGKVKHRGIIMEASWKFRDAFLVRAKAIIWNIAHKIFRQD